MTSLSRRFALVVALALTSAAYAADETYAIKLHRDAKTGDLYDSHVTVEESQSFAVAAQGAVTAPQTQAADGDLTGRIKIGEVDKNGEPLLLTLTITKFTDKSGAELMPPGQVIDIKRSEKETVFTQKDGGNIGAGALRVLKMIYEPIHDADSTDDDMFGSTEKRKVGESWPVHADAMAKSISKGGMEIAAAAITGQTHLNGMESVNGTLALRVQAAIDMKDPKPSNGPPGMTMEGSSIHGEFTGLFPLDPKAPALESQMTMDTNIRYRRSDGLVKMDITSHIVKKEVVTPTKP